MQIDPEVLEAINEILKIVIELAAVILPALITWYIRAHVQGSTREGEWSALMTLAEQSILFVENAAKAGKLDLDEEAMTGLDKLHKAVDWLIVTAEAEGVKKLTPEEATALIQAKFEEMVGGVQGSSKLPEWVSQAVSAVLAWEAAGHVPPSAGRIEHLTSLGADYVEKLALEQRGSPDATGISREQTEHLVRVGLLDKLSTHTIGAPAGDRLMELAREAVATVRKLEAEGQLTVKGGGSVTDMVREIATAMVLNNAVAERLEVDADDVDAALAAAFREQSEGSA